MSNFIKIIIMSLSCYLLAACNFLSPADIPQEKIYRITAKDKITNSGYSSKKNFSLLVFPPVASPGYQTNQMIYVQKPYQLKHYANHRWVSPPATMMLDAIEQNILQKNFFKAVVTAPFTGSTDFQLELQLIEFQQDFIRPTSSAKIIISATLVSTYNGKIVASKLFKFTAPAPGNNAYSGVIAMNKAAQKIAAKISQFTIYYSQKSKKIYAR